MLTIGTNSSPCCPTTKFGTANDHVLVTNGPRPTLTYYAPSEATRDEVVLIVSTPGNLLSTTTIPIDVK